MKPEFEKGKTLFYRIVSGTAYQFAVEVLENGGDSARYGVCVEDHGEVRLRGVRPEHGALGGGVR